MLNQGSKAKAGGSGGGIVSTVGPGFSAKLIGLEQVEPEGWLGLLSGSG
jgi:hypothetical protein